MPEIDGNTADSGVLTYFHGRQSNQGFIATPAFALSKPSGIDPALASNMEIIWAKGIAPLNNQWMNCARKTGGELLSALLTNSPQAEKLLCPYHRTISANHLLNSIGDRDVENAITGKTVFYGAGFRFTGDRIESPVYGEMPGVYLHAMAYDNLLTFGRNYKRAERSGWISHLIDGLLLIMATGVLVFLRPSPQEDTATLESFIKTIKKSTVGVSGAIFILYLASMWGLDGICIAIASLYVLLRFFQKNAAFLLFFGMTLTATVFGFYVLDLGPRNILAFVVFFEFIAHFQEKLIHRAEQYFKFPKSLDSTDTLTKILAPWLDRFFLIFTETKKGEAP